MKITNINSEYKLEFTDQLQLTFDVLGVLMVQEQNSILKINLLNKHSLLDIFGEIPYFLLHPEYMPHNFNDFGYAGNNEDENDKEEDALEHNFPSEFIAFYVRAQLGYGNERPAIYFCPERIEEVATSNDGRLSRQTIVAIVLLHELAHAWMDSHSPSISNDKRDEFYHWMEEAMANFMMLKIFEWYSKHYTGYNVPLNQAIMFVKSQPVNYKLGYDFSQYKWIEEYCVTWAGEKERILSKEKEKINLLNYVRANVGKTKETELLPLFVDLFKYN